MSKLSEAIDILQKYNQNHIIDFLYKIDGIKQEKLIDQILSIDFNQIMQLFENTQKPNKSSENEIEPVKYIDKSKLTKEKKLYYKNLGKKVLKNKQYAIITMAGGQGTRLNHNGPKGTFKINVLGEEKSLFEILAESILRENEKYDITIPWYIMTSRENNDETIDFFVENKYFGYPKDKIKFFKQSELPLISQEGKLLIDENNLIKEASDGNGGIFSSMRKSGILDEMKKSDIEWIFIGAVDNPLLQMVDEVLLGVTIEKNNFIASRTIAKAYPEEKVGVFCLQNKKPKVIEYTEIPENMVRAVDSNGELLFGEAHIMCNLFNINALEKVSKENLMYHKALKKVNYIDENGKLVTKNAYKFEAFIFDSFEFFDDITIVRGKREENFAPIKNAIGQDSPKTAEQLYNKYYTNLNEYRGGMVFYA